MLLYDTNLTVVVVWVVEEAPLSLIWIAEFDPVNERLRLPHQLLLLLWFGQGATDRYPATGTPRGRST